MNSNDKLNSNGLGKVWEKVFELIKRLTGDVDVAGKGDLQTQLGKLQARIAGYAVTGGTTSAYTVSIDGATLIHGTMIVVRFNAANAANATLNVNSLGAKPIYYKGAAVTASRCPANAVIALIYDTAQVTTGAWHCLYSYDSNTTYTNVALGQGYATCSTAAETTAKVGTLSSYALVTGGIVTVKFTYDVPAGATLNINSKGAKSIYHRGAAITAGVIKAGDTAAFIYSSQYHLIAIDRDDDTIYTHSSYTARTGVPTANQTPAFGGIFSVSQPITDSTGHVTALNSRNVTIPSNEATTSEKGLMSAADKTKLSGIAAGAEVNQNTFSNVVVGDTTIAADAKTDTLTLAGSNVTLTPDATNDKVTIGITKANVTSALGYTPVNSTLKGVAGGLAELDSNGKVPSSQLPSFVDDVLEYSSKSSFPATGETGKIYVDTTTNKTYRWSGSDYVEISASLALGETSSTAYRGDRGKTAYEHSQKTSGNPHGVTKSDVELGNVPNVATNDQTPTYSAASTLATLTSGEKLSVSMGKIMKAITDFISHKGDTSNPHGVTKSQVGLGDVDNTADANKSVASAAKWSTARNINGMSVQGDANRVNYGTCSTAAATAAKTVACTGFALVTGAEITVKFTVTNTASSPTLNVNSTGAKAIYYRGSAISAGYLAANRTYTFRYNGTQYELVGDINTDTNTKNTAGSTDSSEKLFLIGATSQAANPQTYSHDTAYIGPDGYLYSGDVKTQTITGDTKDNTVAFTSADSTDPEEWTDTEVLKTEEKHSSIFNKISTMFKNIRWLYKMFGTTDISKIGDGTATGAIAELNNAKVDTTTYTTDINNIIAFLNKKVEASTYNADITNINTSKQDKLKNIDGLGITCIDGVSVVGGYVSVYGSIVTINVVINVIALLQGSYVLFTIPSDYCPLEEIPTLAFDETNGNIYPASVLTDGNIVISTITREAGNLRISMSYKIS